MKIKKIIVSGGWGYYNLGDDAICSATIKILQRKYPNAKIIVLTYDVEETAEILNSYHNIEIIESLHKILFNDISVIERSMDFFYIKKKLIRALKRRGIIQDRMRSAVNDCLFDTDSFVKRYNDQTREFISHCSDADLYIMSGGHYINDWRSSLVSKYIELYLSKKMGLSCYMMGQTIGPFLFKNNEKLAKRMYNMVDGFFFRDKESIEEVKKWGINTKYDFIVPDIALYDRNDIKRKNQNVLIIPFSLDLLENVKILSKNLSDYISQTSSRVIITVSQLWGSQMYIASALYIYLKNCSINVTLVIPNNVNELQKLIDESGIVLSQNLHGLILAYRSGIPIICMNNKRKFISFMEITSQADAILVPENFTKENLCKLSLTQCEKKRKIVDFREDLYNTVDALLPSENI